MQDWEKRKEPSSEEETPSQCDVLFHFFIKNSLKAVFLFHFLWECTKAGNFGAGNGVQAEAQPQHFAHFQEQQEMD